MSNLGLPVKRVANVQILLSPKAASTRDFGSLVILGDSGVVDVAERLRKYDGIEAIATDYGVDAPEYKAAVVYMSQKPQPAFVYLGAANLTASAGLLRGGILTTIEAEVTPFKAVTAGKLTISIDGAEQVLDAIDWSAATNLNGVAAVIDTKLTTATCTWDDANMRFIVRSSSTGTASTVDFAKASADPDDVAHLLKLRASDGGVTVAGVPAEQPVESLTALAGVSNKWYGVMFATKATLTYDQIEKAAEFIEAASTSHIFGVSVSDPAELDINSSKTQTAYKLSKKNLRRTFTYYSTDTNYGAATVFGRAFTVLFQGENTTITLKFKDCPGVKAESLSTSQADVLEASNCNVFVEYDNDTAILEQGVMCDGTFFDEIHGTDWLQNDVQTEVYNMLRSNTKIPQTDAGVGRIIARICARLEQGVRNGLIAPGVWTLGGFGKLNEGDMLTKGYYVYAPSVSTQSQADREKRKAPVIQAAVKLAGAIHSVDVLINVNR